MINQPKLTKSGKLVIASVAFLLAVLLALLLYISLAYDKTSEYLVEARRELELGNKDNAYSIYYEVIGKDASCEEAYRALAELSEERVNYKDAAYFWLMTSRLNPLDGDAKRKYFEALIISGADDFLEMRYETELDKSIFSDREKFYVAKSYIKSGKLHKSKDLAREIKSNSYKFLLSAISSFEAQDAPAAADKFKLALGSAKSENEKNNARVGLAVCALAAGDDASAKRHTAEIAAEDALAAGDRLALEVACAELDGDGAKAVDSLYKLARTRRYQISPILECAEAACARKDKGTILKLKGLNGANDKTTAELFYFLSAAEAAAGEDWAEAGSKLEFSGNFSKTVFGQILELKIARDAGDAHRLKKAAEMLAKSKSLMTDRQKSETVAILSEALKHNQSEESLISCILAIDPQNPFANMIAMRDAFSKGDFPAALKSAKIALERLGHTPSAFNIACASAFSLKLYSETAAMAKNRLAADPSDMFAALFCARALAASGKSEEALGLYRRLASAEKTPILTVAEAAGFFLENGNAEDFKSALAKIEKDPSAEAKFAALSLKAENARKKGDCAARAGFLREMAKENPQSEALAWELAQCLLENGDAGGAISVMQKISEKANTPSAKFRLAVLLRDGSPKQLARSAEIFKELAAAFPSESNVYLEYSKTLEKSGDKTAALALARRADEINPNNADAALHLGKMLLGQNLDEDAVLALEKSHRAQNSEEAKKLLESALNSVASRAGVPAERKINALRRLIQLDPHNAKAGAELKRLLDLSKK